MGLLAAIYLGSLGVKILLVHPTQTRLDTAARLKILSPAATLIASEDVAERITERNGGYPVDAALICTTRAGAPAALRQAVAVVRDGGCIDLVTNYPEGADAPHDIDPPTLRATRSANVCGSPKGGRYLLADISGRRLAFTGHRGTSHTHLEKALHALRGNAASYMRLITHVLSLHEAAAAIQRLAESESHTVHGLDCIKVAIDMSKRPLPGPPEERACHV